MQSRTCPVYAEARKGRKREKFRIVMKRTEIFYVEPELKTVRIATESGYAASGGFEQPEFGGEDDL